LGECGGYVTSFFHPFRCVGDALHFCAVNAGLHLDEDDEDDDDCYGRIELVCARAKGEAKEA